MENGILKSSTIPILQQVISFAQDRHEVLAGNVANLDTPGYRVRDLSIESFQQRLKDAIAARNQRNEPLSPGMTASRRGDALSDVSDSMRTILFHDDSDVGMEQQVLQMSKNQFMHNLAISLMNTQFQMLQTAISERV
ncbi:MAG: flagellar basal body rod protein FlgB [Pirellulaceae bacterium]|jgi:flagellar basal-body rod protein FlgB|nr:flagellar basal body rod protein FlgB [Pirellulaceae bacterium]MDP6553572.1 flagellar basal body rod protein FlgB [Pirellulaceae bacterium]